MILRWICKGCKTKWIYPVEVCIHCGGKTERIIGKKLKVVGCTTVSIPSLSHPIIPYNVLILEDELGNRMPKKSMKDYKIGDAYTITSSKEKSSVAIIKVKYDIPFAVETAMGLVPKIKLGNGTKILIKPSAMAPAQPFIGMSTNPEVLSALIHQLVSMGARKENITVAEQVQFGDFGQTMSKSGIGELCKKMDVKLLDILKGEFVEKKSGDYRFMVSRLVYENDLVINLPVYKTHLMLGISGALENMTRTLHPDNTKELTGMDVNDAIANLFKVLPDNMFVLGDCTIGLQGNGPMIYGEPAFMNKVLASHDPVAIDRIFIEMGMLKDAAHVTRADDAGIGESELTNIEVVGEELDACRYELKPAVGSRLIKGM